MGRYFGIANGTKEQRISSYWKADEWCNCYEVMHQFHWDKTDAIYSGCYSDYWDFEYDPENNKMICVNKDDADITLDKSPFEDCYEEIDERTDEEYLNAELKYKSKHSDAVTKGCYGFDMRLCNNKKYNHLPKWDGDKCVNCGYVYDENRLEFYAKLFNGVYHFN
jgi:hypothetical protein